MNLNLLEFSEIEFNKIFLRNKNKRYLYVLFYKKVIVYIGITYRLYARLYQHKERKKFDKVYSCLINSKEAEMIEHYLITIFLPKYNSKSGFGGGCTKYKKYAKLFTTINTNHLKEKFIL